MLLVACCFACSDEAEFSMKEPEIVQHSIIWTEKHSAFPSIVHYRDKYFVAFRVGDSHRGSNVNNGEEILAIYFLLLIKFYIA